MHWELSNVSWIIPVNIIRNEQRETSTIEENTGDVHILVGIDELEYGRTWKPLRLTVVGIMKILVREWTLLHTIERGDICRSKPFEEIADRLETLVFLSCGFYYCNILIPMIKWCTKLRFLVSIPLTRCKAAGRDIQLLEIGKYQTSKKWLRRKITWRYFWITPEW